MPDVFNQKKLLGSFALLAIVTAYPFSSYAFCDRGPNDPMHCSGPLGMLHLDWLLGPIISGSIGGILLLLGIVVPAGIAITIKERKWLVSLGLFALAILLGFLIEIWLPGNTSELMMGCFIVEIFIIPPLLSLGILRVARKKGTIAMLFALVTFGIAIQKYFFTCC